MKTKASLIYIISLMLVLTTLLSSCCCSSILGDVTGTESSSAESELPSCGGHTDDDANDYCDECGTYVVVVVDFYTINDLHGKFVDNNSHIGATYLLCM